jgi:IS5 family transposase
VDRRPNSADTSFRWHDAASCGEFNWERRLKAVHKEDGRTGYEPLKMFKSLLLGQWHSLPALEQSLRVRLDFLQFTGFSLGDSLPDETTLCRFRGKLVKQNKFDALLNEQNRQLEGVGLKVKSANSAETKEILRAKQLKNGLMYKCFRGTQISKIRWRIEQCFDTIKRRFCYDRASYFSSIKVDSQFKMKAICLNLLKAMNKLEFA